MSIIYSSSFEDEKNRIVAAVVAWAKAGYPAGLDLDQFESMIAIKGIDRAITAENRSFRRYVMQSQSAIGRTLDNYLLPDLSEKSQRTDSFVLDGVTSLEFDHLFRWEDGRLCTLTSFKRCLDELQSTKYKILLITRFKCFSDVEDEGQRPSLGDYVVLLQSLDAIDQAYCRGIVQGDSTRDIASRVGLTSRSIELRRQKILDLFGFQRPIEIVKLIVRLEEKGLLEGWC